MISDRDAAIDYMRQLQSRGLVFEIDRPPTKAKLSAWVEANTRILDQYARLPAGDREPIEGEAAQQLLQAIKDSEVEQEVEHPLAHRIIADLCQACDSYLSDLGSGLDKKVVRPIFGVTPAGALNAFSVRVPFTNEKLVLVSPEFFWFCNYLAKIISTVISIEVTEAGLAINFNPEFIREGITEKREALARLSTLIASYALTGRSLLALKPHFLPPVSSLVRMHILRAMELFTIAHEYGHIQRDHCTDQAASISIGDEQLEELIYFWGQEFEADTFGLLTSSAIGFKEENMFAQLGAGAVMILAASEMVSRARTIFSSGSDELHRYATHPPVVQRRQVLRETTSTLFPPDIRTPALQMQDDFAVIMEILWDQIQPFFIDLYQAGVRPIYDEFQKMEQ